MKVIVKVLIDFVRVGVIDGDKNFGCIIVWLK